MMELFQYTFMRNAFLAVCIITPLFGMLGTLIVNNRLAFFSDALGHSALTGVAIGVVFGVSDTNITMLLFAVCFALLLNRIKRKNTVSSDTVISVFASLSMALGLVILSHGGSFSNYSALLVGDILSISRREILFLLLAFAAALLFWLFCFNKLQVIGINASLAKSKRIPVRLLDDCFVVLIAVIVMLSIKWVGILIINALLILPAAGARNLAANMREYHLFSVMISVSSGVLGLFLSYYLNTAAGPMIVILASLFFLATFAARPFFKS